ncbi:MAG: DUF1549 domain-containing protein [Bryobacteraceae bacterium]
MRMIFVVAGMAMAQPGDFFEQQVRPLLAARCQGCHNPQLRTGKLDLTTASGFRQGPGMARLLEAVSYESKIKMPPGRRLADPEIATLRKWADLGAPWPEPKPGASNSGTWWSFQPLRKSFQHESIDAFLDAARAKAGLSAAPPASKAVWIRRATFDLTGLPPTPAEIRAFLADDSSEAYARVVDRLLASPRYGERWGRHWLDVARYADSTGADEDHRYPHAWRYRDYVIDSYNRDLPYDQFVREQIAGDLLPAPGGGVNVQGIVATGFLALGPKLIAEQDKPKMFYDIVDEQIDTVGKAMLGLTLGCARCHDHKFDPIPTKDYYSMASIFASTKQLSKIEGTVSQLYFAPLVPKDVAEAYESHKKKTEDKQKEIDAVIGAEQRRQREQHAPRMAEYMLAAHEVYTNGKAAADEAKARGLDPRILEQWAKYLKPTRERRPQIEEFYQATDQTRPEVARKFQAAYEAETKRRSENKDQKFLAGDNRFYSEVNAGSGPFALPKENPEKLYLSESVTKLEKLRPELEALKKSGPPEPPLACAVAEGDPVEQRVFIRGNTESKGDPVPKRFPRAIAGENQPPITSGSGRLELARWISSPDHPLTARVMVNRIWQGHFGEGLVRTTNTFGKLGEQPSNPELLDWLAADFIRSGWSIKAMHRRIMLSRAYRMSSQPSPEALEKDADNRFLSRFSRRRLTVEEIRDGMLAIDGSLDLTMGGTFLKGMGTDNEFAEGRKSLNPDDAPRRLVYMPLRRSNLPSLLNLFDFGDATTSNEGRTQTNIAPQALYMMNSPFVEQRAQNLAKQWHSDDAGVDELWWRVLGKQASTTDRADATRYVERFPGTNRQLAWTSYCRTLLASNEFLYVQ